MVKRLQKWDIRFLGLAEYISSFSKDPSTKVGSVIVYNTNEIVSLGYNGFPVGDEDKEEEYNDRQIKYGKVIHSEENSIKFAEKNGYPNLNGCTIYTTPFQPCEVCSDLIIAKGIKRVVSYHPTEDQEKRWGESFKNGREKFESANIELVLYKYPSELWYGNF